MTRFADLIGQKLASGVLSKAVRDGQVRHAYLFIGSEGTGKTTTALAFASALNCASPTETGDACGECVSCRMTEGIRHPDVSLISPEGAQTKIDQMREMRHNATFGPVMGRWKVVIIEQADTMNENAANCILKTLEEPPPYLVIILLSRNPSLMLPTIISRCLAVRFSNAGADELARALVERYSVSDEKARFLAAYSEGRPGTAISLIDDEEFAEWRRRMVELAGTVHSSDLRQALRLSQSLLDIAVADKEAGVTQRAAMRAALAGLLLWYRDLLSLSVRGGGAEVINSDLMDELSSVAIEPNQAASAIETLLWARRAVEGNANVQLISDVTMMRLARVSGAGG